MRSAITAAGLRKAYGDHLVLDGVDLDVAEGTIFALLGPNGDAQSMRRRTISSRSLSFGPARLRSRRALLRERARIGARGTVPARYGERGAAWRRSYAASSPYTRRRLASSSTSRSRAAIRRPAHLVARPRPCALRALRRARRTGARSGRVGRSSPPPRRPADDLLARRLAGVDVRRQPELVEHAHGRHDAQFSGVSRAATIELGLGRRRRLIDGAHDLRAVPTSRPRLPHDDRPRLPSPAGAGPTSPRATASATCSAGALNVVPAVTALPATTMPVVAFHRCSGIRRSSRRRCGRSFPVDARHDARERRVGGEARIPG